MEKGGTLEVTVGAGEDDTVVVALRDTGPGIDVEDVGRLFEPFFTTKEGGTGLGLALANKIVTAHGGTIEYKNRATGGAEFTIVLPVGRIDRTGRRAEAVTVTS
jgi:signal transduction histidine kinase